MKIGVLASQGAFIEHITILKQLEAEAVPVRLPRELKGLDGLIIPGGESTTISKLMAAYNLMEEIRAMARGGMPLFGTCAGMILMARQVTGRSARTLGLMDITVSRNAFGRQVDSFEADLHVPALGDPPYRAVFIRAPIIEDIGPAVEVLARLPEGTPVAARQGRLLATAFHPELTSDDRFHRFFLEHIVQQT